MKPVTPPGDVEAITIGTGPSFKVSQYRTPARVMHWITAVLVLFMFGSGVIATQFGGGPVADTLFAIHKMTGALIMALIVMRVFYRLARAVPGSRRLWLHWTLYAIAALVPFMGWAGVSDFGAREIAWGYSLPKIWPEGLGYDEILLRYHAYLAFAFVGLVALHIGVAMQDYLTDPQRSPLRDND